MTTFPSVELRFNPTELRPRDLPAAGAFLGSPADALEAALAVARARMVDQMKAEVRGLSEPNQAQLLRLADLAWQGAFWQFRKISAPVLADAYVRAYRAADAGDVPMSVIYDLADRHAEKVGDYFHASSRDALADGFTTMVNRRLPAKAAADRVLDAYGLTPRQMRAYTSAKQFQTPVDSPVPRALKAKVRAYVDKSFTGRVRKMASQEEHNIDEQAKQYAWMWLQEKDRLSPRAQKMWITAKDERVCPVCGPLHGKRVGVNERFVTAEGEFWTPGLHPNCRCQIRLLENRFSKAFDWDPEEHPRGGDPKNKGRFSRRSGPKFKEPDQPVIEADIWQSLRERTVDEPEEPVIEERVSLARPEKIGLPGTTGRVGLGGKVGLGTEKVGLAGAEKVSLGEQKVALGQEKARVRMSSDEVRERIGMLVSPQLRVAMDAALIETLRRDAAKPAQPRPHMLFYKPTIKIQDENGTEYPVYAVVDPIDVPQSESGRMEFNQDVEFSPNFSQVAGEAYTRFEENIDAIYNDITYSEVHHLRMEPTKGDVWTTELNDELLLNVIAWKAYQNRVSDPDSWGGNPVDVVTWTDRGGGTWDQQVHYSEIADMLRLTEEDFDIKVVRLDEGHDSRLGTTAQTSYGSKHGEETWVTSGVYRGFPASEEEIHHGIQMQIWHLDPEVEEVELETPFD